MNNIFDNIIETIHELPELASSPTTLSPSISPISIQEQNNIENNDGNDDSTESVDSDGSIDSVGSKLQEINCCVCFKDENLNTSKIYSLYDIKEEDIKPETIIKSACEKHFICITCLRTIVNDYVNHPINENNSHVYCPYPFESCLTVANTRNVFDHYSISKILSEEEGRLFLEHAERFAFPGFTVINCPCKYDYYNICNFPVFIENESILDTTVGDLIVHCHQNQQCCKYFCYHCRLEVSRYEIECRLCKTTSENENPNILNRYITKEIIFDDITISDTKSDNVNEASFKLFDEVDYLFLNKNITVEIAVKHIINILENDMDCICPICKINLYKTEKCNGMKHHNIERCYVCGRIGDRIGGLNSNHWDSTGISGCYRFEYDTFVNKYIPEYKCTQHCHNHIYGDCIDPEHQSGIEKINKIRKKTIIYHFIKSLLPDLKYKVLDSIHDLYIKCDKIYELLPYKQTFKFLETYKETNLNYYEDIIYEQLHLIHPSQIDEFKNKKFMLEPATYISIHAITNNVPTANVVNIPTDNLTNQPRQSNHVIIDEIEQLIQDNISIEDSLELTELLADYTTLYDINSDIESIASTTTTTDIESIASTTTSEQSETVRIINNYKALGNDGVNGNDDNNGNDGDGGDDF